MNNKTRQRIREILKPIIIDDAHLDYAVYAIECVFDFPPEEGDGKIASQNS